MGSDGSSTVRNTYQVESTWLNFLLIPCTRVGWKVHRLTMMQWSNMTKCGLFFYIISPAIHTLFQWVLQLLDSCGIEALIPILKKSPQLQIWPHHRSNTAYQPTVFSCWGTDNSQMVLNQENEYGGLINQFKATVMHSSHCNHRLVCRSIVHMFWWNKTPFISFPGCSWIVSNTTSQSPELLIQCGFISKETMWLVPGKVEFNSCQVSLLCHNSFSVNLWTFQPTLIHSCHICCKTP